MATYIIWAGVKYGISHAYVPLDERRRCPIPWPGEGTKLNLQNESERIWWYQYVSGTILANSALSAGACALRRRAKRGVRQEYVCKSEAFVEMLQLKVSPNTVKTLIAFSILYPAEMLRVSVHHNLNYLVSAPVTWPIVQRLRACMRSCTCLGYF